MERNGMMETEKTQAYGWWFDSHDDSHGRSQWLHSTLSELDERAKSMLRIIEEDADSFAQRAEMYYKKRPQLVSLVEDFYRAHRSLAIQFDHLRHDPATRRISPLVRSFSLSTGQSEKVIDPHKSYDGCFTKLACDSEDFLSLPLSKGSPEKMPFDEVNLPELAYDSEESIDEVNLPELAYDSEESIDSEVDDPIPEVSYEIDRLKEEAMIHKEQLMEKEREMEELMRKLYETCNEVIQLKEETETLRVENVEMYSQVQKQQKRMLEEKDEEKREAIRQLSVAIEMLKRENLLLKKSLVNESANKWNPFGFRKLFKIKTSVVPL